MRRWAALFALAFPPLAFAADGRIEVLPRVAADGGNLEVMAEEVLVKFSSAATPASRAAVTAMLGGVGSRSLPGLGWDLVSLSPGMSVLAAMPILQNAIGVESYQPNRAYRPSVVPSDPSVVSQYALNQINAFSAWEYETGASQSLVTIAIIDAGIDGLAQPELSGKLVNSGIAKSKDCNGGACVDDQPPTYACNHGTRVAGVAAATTNNGQGIAGMSWGAQLLSLKVFPPACTPTCGGACFASDASIAAAINYATTLQNNAATGKMVINMSLGGAGGCPDTCPGVNCIELTQTAIGAAVTAGIPVVIAAGNGSGAVEAPANCAGTAGGSGIIPVGATDSLNNVTSFSSRGPELAANGLVAPGKDVLTTDVGGGLASATGTSFSAPHVAGLAALILARRPAFTPLQVQSAIRGGADNIGVSGLGAASSEPQGNISGAGRMNAFRAMRLAVNGTLADFEGDQKAIAFPNPFRISRTGSVSFTVPVSLQGARTTIKVYTVDGQFVRELTGQSWDGKNADGHLVASGTYVFLVATDRGTTRGRVAVIR